MANQHTGASVTDNEEHISLGGLNAKQVVPYVYDGVSGSLISMGSGMVPGAYDYVAYTNTSGTVDTYQFYSGGSGGKLVATITITYTDTTKGQISTVART